jgi:type I restriction enzyme S subunit
MTTINQKGLSSANVPLPPLDEQSQIAHILQTADAKIAAEQDRKGALQELFNSLLQALMTGRLRV